MVNRLWDEKREALRAVLREARVEQGLTQVEVSLNLGKPQSYVSKYESGERKLDFVEVLDIAEILGLEPDLLVSRYLSKVS
ncbi:helix-turn-helix domain-containing protein [Marinomonas atlantica]|uniref:helix-turn-helix domain-containing protein n=1 Tax=Marinomonas atlantica TaxID=1806668 RepID=UPI00082D1AE7|nr:helix-turn-helix transcriptional regulator [Marinomonas atlantica]